MVVAHVSGSKQHWLMSSDEVMVVPGVGFPTSILSSQLYNHFSGLTSLVSPFPDVPKNSFVMQVSWSWFLLLATPDLDGMHGVWARKKHVFTIIAR